MHKAQANTNHPTTLFQKIFYLKSLVLHVLRWLSVTALQLWQWPQEPNLL